MHIRILSEHPAIEGKCGDVVEVDGADPTIQSLIAIGLIEPAAPPPPAEAEADEKPADPPPPAKADKKPA